MSLGSEDPLSDEVRAAEREIDATYKRNPLLKESYAVAAWHVLLVVEDIIFLPTLKGRQSLGAARALHDNLVNGLRHVFTWLRAECEPGGSVPPRSSPDLYTAAADLIDLGIRYRTAVIVFTLASAGKIDVRVDGKTLHTSFRHGSRRFAAYDMLARFSPERLIDAPLDDFWQDIDASTKTSERQFTIRNKWQLIARARGIVRRSVGVLHLVPADWRFTHYGVSDFREAATTLVATAFVRQSARRVAANRGVDSLGLDSALEILGPLDLRMLLTRVGGLDRDAAGALQLDLSLGGAGVRLEDPALQPIIPLGDGDLAISPGLLLLLELERNFLALMNKIPREREVYAALVDEKEEMMRRELEEAANAHGYRCWTGRIPGKPELPDIDLLIIDEASSTVLVLELKWFIEPAETREVLQKANELTKGKDQVRTLLDYAASNRSEFLHVVGLDAGYEVFGAVVSRNTIETRDDDESIPVVQLDHLTRRLANDRSLAGVVRWLVTGDYLPVEGVHFEVSEMEKTVGDWTILWPGFRTLVDPPEFVDQTTRV